MSPGQARSGGSSPGRRRLPAPVPPGPGGDVVERLSRARCVVVEDVPAGQPPDDEAGELVPAPRPPPHLGLVPLQPGQLGADRLGGEAVPAELLDRILAEERGEASDLLRRPAVDAVEDRRPERIALLVGNQGAGADAADADPAGGPGGRAELGDEGPDVAPPDPVGVVLELVGGRGGGAVRSLRRGEDVAALGDQHRLAAGGADVDPQERCLHPGNAQRDQALPPHSSDPCPQSSGTIEECP